MKFTYCPFCGEYLAKKEIGDEGLVPFCLKCNRPVFDLPYTCILSLVVNENNEVALIKQNHLYGCVAGYIKSGENAEEAAKREVLEETGIAPLSAVYFKSYYYEKKDMLMLGFIVKVLKSEFKISVEVDSAEWFDFAIAIKILREGSIAWQLLNEYVSTM